MKQKIDSISDSVWQFAEALQLPGGVVEKSILYLSHVLDYNQKVNIVSRKDEDHIVENHWLHCVVGFAAMDLSRVSRGVDIGSGGGFPGVLLAIFYPHIKFTLVESISKKALFLEKEVSALGLMNVAVVNDRFEKAIHGDPEGYDLMTARAVTSLPKLWNYAEPILKHGGKLFAWKGECAVEVREVKKMKHIKSISIAGPDRFLHLPRIATSQYVIIEKK